jgi:hypothetical protein
MARGIERAGSLLGVVILTTTAWYGRSDRMVVDGALYLVIASCLCLASILLGAIVGAKQRRGIADASDWIRYTRAYVFLLCAWQLAIVGLLNIWAVDHSHDSLVFALCCLSTIVFIICTAMIVRFSDNPKQEGGSRPLNYFGVPRSRSLLFYAFCYLLSPVFIAGIWIFVSMKQIPAPFQPPQLCLLLVSLLTVISMVMVFQRYRQALPNKALAGKILALTACVLGAVATIHIILGYSVYVFVLSLVAVSCVGASLHWLLRARAEPSSLAAAHG